MRHLWILGIFLALTVLIVAAIVGYFLLRPAPVPAPIPNEGTLFPSSGSSDIPGGAQGTIGIRTRSGETLVVRDFTKDPKTVQDEQNPGVYYLAGTPEYCLISESCPEHVELPGANVLYNAADQSFTIALLDEPLRDARISAQQFLLGALGLSQEELCSLSYYVGTDYYVNELYAGQNLGFSFCAGSVALP